MLKRHAEPKSWQIPLGGWASKYPLNSAPFGPSGSVHSYKSPTFSNYFRNKTRPQTLHVCHSAYIYNICLHWSQCLGSHSVSTCFSSPDHFPGTLKFDGRECRGHRGALLGSSARFAHSARQKALKELLETLLFRVCQSLFHLRGFKEDQTSISANGVNSVAQVEGILW